jgi:hypothetical protein
MSSSSLPASYSIANTDRAGQLFEETVGPIGRDDQSSMSLDCDFRDQPGVPFQGKASVTYPASHSAVGWEVTLTRPVVCDHERGLPTVEKFEGDRLYHEQSSDATAAA